jgi:tetratricopeptide repeat protein 21B
MSGEVLALVNYYARAGYYRHLQTVCNEVLKKRGSTDPTLVFWRALGMLKEGAVNDAIRDWEGIKSRGDLQLALPAKLALVHAHQMSKVVDGEEVHRLQNEVSVDEQNAPDRARLTAALLLWHLGELDEAKIQVTRLLQMQPQYVPALTLMGWLELQAVESDESHMVGMDDPEQSLARAESAFEDALAACSAKKDLEALMGKARLNA